MPFWSEGEDGLGVDRGDHLLSGLEKDQRGVQFD